MVEPKTLKPCPFCGGEAKYIDAYWYEGDSAGDYVICTGCGVRNSRKRLVTDPNSIDAWNTRAVEDTLHIPHNVIYQVLAMGRAEWGVTEDKTSDGHIKDFEETLRLTQKYFNLEDIPVGMHGLYLENTETVLCHTGTSPNSGANAMALAGAWNWLYDQCVRNREADV